MVVDESLVDPAFVLAALNSRLGTWILRHGIFGHARLTNHMDAPYLGRFPLPASTPDIRGVPMDERDDAIGDEVLNYGRYHAELPPSPFFSFVVCWKVE